MSITYGKTVGRPARITVYLAGRLVGHINGDAAKGFYYRPLGAARRGETYATLAEVKSSLEGREVGE